MNKQLISLAVAGILAAPVAAQAGEPTLYGKAHLSYGQVTKEANGVKSIDNWQVRSHASRIGVKGSRDLGDGLMAIYKFEFEVNPDSDNKGTLDVSDAQNGSVEVSGDGTAGFARRNMYAGLKGGWGEVRVGRHDTPLKMAQGKFDQFNDTDADLKHAGSQDGENRIDNVVAYLGKTGGLGYAIAVAPGEDKGTGATADTGPADTVSASVSYTTGPLYVAVAHDSYANGGNADKDSLTRVVGTYKMGGMQLGLLWQSGVEKPAAASKEEDWLGLSFAMNVGSSNKVKAQYIKVEDSQATAKETTLSAIGFDHKFDKKTSAYLMYSSVSSDQGSDSTDNTFLGAGMVVKF